MLMIQLYHSMASCDVTVMLLSSVLHDQSWLPVTETLFIENDNCVAAAAAAATATATAAAATAAAATAATATTTAAAAAATDTAATPYHAIERKVDAPPYYEQDQLYCRMFFRHHTEYDRAHRVEVELDQAALHAT